MEEEYTKNSQVGLSNVSPGLSSVLLIDRRDVNKPVQHPTLLFYSFDESGKREVSAYDPIVRWPGIVLDFLYEHDIWAIQILCYVVGDDRDVCRVRSHVLHLAGTNQLREN